MCLAKYLTATFSFVSPVDINNPVSASQARFPQVRVIERSYVESTNKRSDRAAL